MQSGCVFLGTKRKGKKEKESRKYKILALISGCKWNSDGKELWEG